MTSPHTSQSAPPSFFLSVVLAARPKTLVAAFAPILLVFCFLESIQRELPWRFFAHSLFSVLFLQIATNLFNDAIDFKKGADTSTRLGPKRVTAQGWLSPSTVMWLAALFSGLSLLVAWPLIEEAGFWGAIIAGLCLLLAYGYTGGPYPLAYKGLGELFVLIFFGWVAVFGLGILVLHSNRVFDLFVLGTQVGLLSCVLISVNNMRDYEEDRKNRKMTLAARWGLGFAKAEITVFVIAPFLLSLYWLSADKPGALLSWILIPVVARFVLRVRNEVPSQKSNELLAEAGKIQLLFAIATSLGFLVW
jgi:1,4-dihydroxy-2-naphthoate octaprenyltransferase